MEEKNSHHDPRLSRCIITINERRRPKRAITSPERLDRTQTAGSVNDPIDLCSDEDENYSTAPTSPIATDSNEESIINQYMFYSFLLESTAPPTPATKSNQIPINNIGRPSSAKSQTKSNEDRFLSFVPQGSEEYVAQKDQNRRWKGQ